MKYAWIPFILGLGLLLYVCTVSTAPPPQSVPVARVASLEERVLILEQVCGLAEPHTLVVPNMRRRTR